LGGSVSLATDRGLEGAAVDGTFPMGPWSGAVIES
jgi:hypothetical protein